MAPLQVTREKLGIMILDLQEKEDELILAIQHLTKNAFIPEKDQIHRIAHLIDYTQLSIFIHESTFEKVILKSGHNSKTKNLLYFYLDLVNILNNWRKQLYYIEGLDHDSMGYAFEEGKPYLICFSFERDIQKVDLTSASKDQYGFNHITLNYVNVDVGGDTDSVPIWKKYKYRIGFTLKSIVFCTKQESNWFHDNFESLLKLAKEHLDYQPTG